MRKRYKNKKRSCGFYKPHKRKWQHRWKFKDHISQKEFEHLKSFFENK